MLFRLLIKVVCVYYSNTVPTGKIPGKYFPRKLNMKTYIGRLLALFILLVTDIHGSAQQLEKPISPTDDVHATTAAPAINREIILMLEKMSAGLENRNADQIMVLFSKSPDVTFIGSKEGKIARGPEQIRALFEGILSAKSKTRLVWNSHTVNISGNVAWLFALADLVFEDEHGTRQMPYRATSVFLLENEQWKWIQFHGSEPIGHNN